MSSRAEILSCICSAVSIGHGKALELTQQYLCSRFELCKYHDVEIEIE